MNPQTLQATGCAIALIGAWLCTPSAGNAQQSSEAAVTPGAPEELTVDVGKSLNTTRHHPLGINVDYLMDDDSNPLLSPKRPLREALRELGTKYVRYPGGWKSAINLWSSAPYTSSRPTLAGRVPEAWIRPGLQIASPEGTWRIDPFDFDEFMQLCRNIQAEPCIVVPYESCHWEPKAEWKPPSRRRLLDTAAAWVRYANRQRAYQVRYWEVGNESWLNNETWTNRITAKTYAADLVDFAKRMKAEDPSILVGANGDSDEWWRAVLSRAARHIDFLSVHTYPCWKLESYDEYRTNSLEALGAVRVATTAIAQYAPAHRQRLRIMLTEFAAGTFGAWDNTPADLGRALITFDLQGQFLQCRDLYFSQFWNTHNIYSEVDGGVFDALKRDNTLSPVGQALWIWSQFLGEEMVATTSGKSVRCFASHSAGRRLVVFLVNKDIAERSVRVILRRMPSHFAAGVKWVLRGSGPGDRHPQWERLGKRSADFSPLHRPNETILDKDTITDRLDPVSITVLELTSAPSSGVPGPPPLQR